MTLKLPIYLFFHRSLQRLHGYALGCLGMFVPAMLAAAVTVSPPPVIDTLSISLPAHTVEGRLNNGLHYLILPNATPAKTVEMRLVMRLGAVQETDRQKGCAHFLEHMAFAGTEHFPGRRMIDYLEGLGMKFGRDINAVTGYDRTIFMLTVPMTSKDLGVLDSTLLVLRDWLTGIDFKAGRVKQERGVILEELRTYRNDDLFYDLKIGQSRFKERMPLGSADDIRKVKRKDLMKFYKKWYSPQFASLVVVGDVTPAEVEKRISRLFGEVSQKRVDDYRVYPLTYERGVKMHEVRDSIRQNSVLELIIPHPCTVGRDMGSTLLKEREALTAYALDHRLTARHLSCNVSDEWYLSDLNHFVLSFSGTKKEMLLQRIESVASEVTRLIREGWLPEEFERMKADFAENLAVNEEGRPSYSYCDDFTDYILQGDRYLHDEQELEALREGVRATEMSFLQQHLAKLMDEMKQTLLLAYKNNSGAEHHLTEQEILDAWEKGTQQQPEPFVYRVRETVEVKVPTPECLLEPVPEAADAVVAENYLPDTKITEVKLKNGIRLLFRPTPDGDETLLLNFFGKGGLANLSPEKYHRYESTAGFMEMGGIARVPYDTLCDYMAQAGLLLNISIGAYWHDLLGTAPAHRSAELFRLIDEKLHRPELCYADFEEVRKDELESLGESTVLEQLMHRAPDRLLVNRMDSLVGNSPSTWFREKTRADLEQMNLDSIAAYFSCLYAQLDGTTVVMTGNFDLETVRRQAIATFGGMEALAPEEGWIEEAPGFSLPTQNYVEGFDNDNESQTVLEYVYPGELQPSLKNGLTLKLMRDLLQDRMLRVLREQENIVYSPYSSLYYYGPPQNSYYFNLSLSVDRANCAKTDQLLRGIIRELQEYPVSVPELNKLKRAFCVNKQQVLTESAATDWRNIISTMIKNDEAIEDFEHYQQQLDLITPEIVRQAFRHFMPESRTILLYMGKHELYD